MLINISSDACPLQVSTTSGRVGDVGSGRVGSGRVGSGRVGSGRVGSGRRAGGGDSLALTRRPLGAY